MPEPISCLIDGAVADTIAADSRALHYGDGLFETIAVSNSTPQLWQYHWERLELGCNRLGIALPERTIVEGEIDRLSGAMLRPHVIKLIVTRSADQRGYRPVCSKTQRILLSYQWPDYGQDYRQQGVQLSICSIRLGRQPMLAGIKHLNRLEQVLAASRLELNSQPEGLLLDFEERLISGISSNLFLVHEGRIATPDLRYCGVAGTMRRHILELARRNNIEVYEGDLDSSDLATADEVFLTNSLIGIWPVREVEGRAVQIGPITRDLQSMLVTSLEQL